MTATLFPIRYRLSDLVGVPKEEVAFHLAMGRIGNELVILRMQALLASTGAHSETAPQSEISSAAAILNAKLLTGRLLEAWEFLRSEETGKVYRSVLDNLSENAKARRKEIMKYFGADNMIERLRNKIAFHIDAKTTFEAVEALDPATEVTDWLSEYQGQTFYGGGWTLSSKQLQILLGDGDIEALLGKWYDEISAVALMFLDFVEDVNSTFLERRLKLSKKLFSEVREDYDGLPDLREAEIPYVFDASQMIEDASTMGDAAFQPKAKRKP